MLSNPSQVAGGQLAGRQLVLAVRIGGALYALPLDAVEEVLPALPIEWLPQSPAHLRGVVFVRGKWILVFDAAECLGVPHQRPLAPPVVCLRLDGPVVGLEVDEVLDLLELGSRPSLAAERLGGALAAAVDVDGQLIRLLDVRRLGLSSELVERDSVEKMPFASE